MAYTLQESQTSSDGGAAPASAAYHLGQTFKAESSYPLTKVELLLYREGTPPNVTIEIQDTTTGAPNNNVLATESIDVSAITTNTNGEWVEIEFGTPAVLSINTTYAIVFADGYTDNSNRCRWRQYINLDLYADGSKYYATTGENWYIDTGNDFTFKTYSGSDAVYVDFAGTGGGVGDGSGILTVRYVDMAGTGGGVGDGSGILTVQYVDEEEKVEVIRMSSQKSRPDNQQVFGGGQIVILGLESDNQNVMGENVVNLDVDNVIGR